MSLKNILKESNRDSIMDTNTIINTLRDDSKEKLYDVRFVVRQTDHPEDDLERNWSAPMGGWDNELANIGFDTEDEAREADEELGNYNREYQYHPKYEGYVLVDYEGLGAWNLEADNLEEAIEEAKSFGDGLGVTMGAGDGHFFANEVIDYYEVKDGIYVFELKT